MRAKRHALHLDLRRTFAKSLGRFFSSACLMALGSFALIGLKVSGPDMRLAGEKYFHTYDLADMVVIGDMGLDAHDQETLSQARGVKKVEYGYLVDVTVGDTDKAIRVASAPKNISQYEIVEGRMPESDDEITLTASMKADYPLGSSITLKEKLGVDGSEKLSRHEFTVVGYVHSTEIVSSVSLGQTKVGTGDLKGYAVVTPHVFTTDYYMIARLVFDDTEGLDPYSQKYLAAIAEHKEGLHELLQSAPEHRLAVVQSEYQDAIVNGQGQLDDAQQKLNDAQTKLRDARAELDEGQESIVSASLQIDASKAQIRSAQELLESNQCKLDEAALQIDSGQKMLADKRTQLDDAYQQLQSGRAQLDDAHAQLQSASTEISAKETELNTARQKIAEYDAGRKQITDTRAEIAAKRDELDAREAELKDTKETLESTGQSGSSEYASVLQGLHEISDARQELANKALQVDAAETQLDAHAAQIEDLRMQVKRGEQILAAARQEYDKKETVYKDGESAYAEKEAAYKQGMAQLASAQQALEMASDKYRAGVSQLNEARAQLASKQSTLDSALQRLNSARSLLSDKEEEYNQGLLDYNNALPEALQKIADGEQSLADAREQMSQLEEPHYTTDSRREMPGSNGYTMYGNVSEIIDSLADIFPYFLYFVAALVTLTTMTRMVDEERIDSGTFKALGYSNRDVIGKFVCYGFAASMTGTIIGVIAGHILIPLIVNNAYATGFTMPVIKLNFYPLVTLAAFGLALLSAVVPAYLVARHEVVEKPAALLLPKPPSNGSKILLEHIRPLWSHLSFTQKVTARNLFRYKKRALMTVCGVAGSVALIFAGFAVQNSIDGIGTRQFGKLIEYDLIVAEKNFTKQDEQTQINDLLASEDVDGSTSIYFETVNKVAGNKDDTQPITMIVPEDTSVFESYIHLRDRSTGAGIQLSDEGAVISERLATLTGTKVGDTFTFKDEQGNEHSVRVNGITEMYINHFIFMSKKTYEQTFGVDYKANAHMVKLVDTDTANAAHMAAKFMGLSGVKGVVQNVSYINQINVIVRSLNKIMGILIVLSTLLAVVILYNLVTINVSERIRELSTIKVLGFYRQEVTMYIYKETMILSAIGVPVGWLLGRLLQLYIIKAVPPETVMFDPNTGILAFCVPALVVAVVVAALYFVVNAMLRRVDMLEALKSVD